MKFSVIYADPPWKFGGTGGTKWSSASSYYRCLSDSELMKLNIKKIAEDDCILFCWITAAHLKEGILVCEAWGFKYITIGFVWYKERANVGNYTMPQCEFCLIFKRGKIPKDRVRNPGIKSFFSGKIGRHSEKPDEIRQRIAKMFPTSKKVELFARERHSDWCVYGDQVKADVKL